MTSGALLLEAGGSYNADAQAAFNAMTVQPSSQRKSLYNALIPNLKADGLWSKLDWLCIMAAHDAQAARRKLRAPTKSLAAVNTPAFVVDRGYAGNNLSSHLSFGEAFNATGNVYALFSVHLGVWCSAQGVTDEIRSQIGSSQSTRSFISPSTAGAGAARMNDCSSFNLGAVKISLGAAS